MKHRLQSNRREFLKTCAAGANARGRNAQIQCSLSVRTYFGLCPDCSWIASISGTICCLSLARHGTKRAAQTAAQGFAPADSPTTTANQKKGDTSNEVKKGAFLKRLDTFPHISLTPIGLGYNLSLPNALPIP